jgi:hypothetical protein
MEAQWKTYLDLNSFLCHFLVGELSGNTDTYWSVFMYKERDDDMMYTGPVWDFDLAFNNDNRTYPINNKKNYIYRSGGSVTGNMQTFVDDIVIRDADAKAKLFEIWSNAREHGINEEHLFDFINQLEADLQESQKLNFTRWPIMNWLVHQNPVIWGSYAKEVQNVRRYLSERLQWMDKKLEYTYTPTGIADVAPTTTQPYQVFNMSGKPCGSDLQHLPKGIYIVSQGQQTRKIQVK